MTSAQIANVLLVEDSISDVVLFREALKDGKLLFKLHTVQDGDAALAYVRKENHYAHEPRPDLIILDLNLPKKSGLKVLEEIKKDSRLKEIPVVVVTSSSAEDDIRACYNLQASCYITKPIRFDEFINAIRSIGDFWLSVVRLPPRGAAYSGA